ncbi:AMP-binding protein (plasmid) [Streptomyces sp. BI20]|uniref:AMP-binding protein n=1 Tax=Streptomyces sp. BI20 TaxID=3403460 RepID=UPI003C74AD65
MTDTLPTDPLTHELLLRGPADRDAVDGPTGTWSYARLTHYARTCAAEFLRHGLTDGARVLVALEPTAEAVGVFLACSMAGAVYVPVSPDTPAPRVREIAAHVEAAAWLHAPGAPPPPAPVAHAAEVTAEGPRFHRGAPRPVPHRRALGTDPAYIVFTSGTTGRPKGITNSHRSLVAFFRALTAHFALPGEARVGSFSPLSFDLSLLDLGLALGSGATLVQVPRMLVHHPRRLLRRLDAHGVSLVSAVPSVWRPLLATAGERIEVPAALRAVHFTGEHFPGPEVRRLARLLPGVRLTHGYGQSESIQCSFRDLPDPIPETWDAMPIGPAHEGCELLLLDENGKPVTEPGDTGELHLRGTTLFSGYWGDPDATAAALVPDPTRPLAPERVLRTGDLATLTEDGEFRFAGRRDHQVQIRGNRVELEEIERVLLEHPAVAGVVALVTDRGEGAEPTVCVVPAAPSGPNAPATPSERELRAHCRERLPDYMVPRRVVLVPALPHSVHGKLDRRAAHALASAAHPPREGTR